MIFLCVQITCPTSPHPLPKVTSYTMHICNYLFFPMNFFTTTFELNNPLLMRCNVYFQSFSASYKPLYAPPCISPMPLSVKQHRRSDLVVADGTYDAFHIFFWKNRITCNVSETLKENLCQTIPFSKS